MADPHVDQTPGPTPAPAPQEGAGAPPEPALGPDEGAVAEDAPGPDEDAVAEDAPVPDAVAEPPGPAEPEDDRSPEELRTALAEAERLRDDYLDQAQRARAEYQNLKRRSDEALAVALDRGAERLVTRLTGVLDNVGYLVDAIADDDETQVAKGVRMVTTELATALEAAGMQPIPGLGSAFDPEVHEALLSEESAEPLDEPTVVEVLRPGYRFKGRTLRPASVKVAR